MDLETIAGVGLVVLFPVALFVFFKMMVHLWFVVTGIRHDKALKASLLGPFAFFMPSLFEEKARVHLSRLSPWLLATIVCFVALFVLKELAGLPQ